MYLLLLQGEWVTLTGGVAVALTTKEVFLIGDWNGLPPTICLAASAEEAMDDEEINACVAIFFLIKIDF